ncbi:asparagine synthase (glutamine-hydrolyzing) (plasmid) [Azospirillum argentinense]|uniref:asparagine synthase (glutamine-hydrolyzing) n=1 Tax=Azospirillum argentinense TaxID=2970906 RepID=A0A4D8PSU8_9PROT|nr:asparagine synthase (glutamine-hydrolyzing) [Azospirillum argentinense]QCO00401.1 asparagine synthase (glutamine-hydrolyzing) [Azospirillum argentinense]
MCGIAGYFGQRPVGLRVVEEMVAALTHRGPDGDGFLHRPPFVAGMRRLGINDPEHGQQPLTNGDGSVALFYNGEIYNSPDLRRDLERKGHRFRTGSDGEVIAHLYDEVGEDLFEWLDGMFAVALWIEREQRLILARDLPGEKPLYYAEPAPGELVFASELGALQRFPGLALDLDLQALWDFPTFLWVPEPASVFRKVRALEPGHLLSIDANGLRRRPYANRFGSHRPAGTDAELVAETRRVVTDAVTSRLLSDVPIGAFLSSGLDSSIVTTIAASAAGRLTTFSVGFEDAADPYHGRADESAAASDYARRLGLEHRVIRVSSDDFLADLETFCRHGGEPFAVSSGLGILAVARAAREQGIKVLLSGDGADELFGGYSWYRYLDIRVPAAVPDRTVSFQNVGLPLEERLAAIAGYPPSRQAWAWHYYAAEDEKARLFHPDAFPGVQTSLRHFAGLDARSGEMGSGCSAEDFIGHDRGFYLPNEMLRKLDRMCMAFSVEGRAPFVAPAVLTHARTLGSRHMMRGDTLKWALRQAFADLIPADVLERPKHGFNVPIDLWLNGPWSHLVERTFAPGSALDRTGLLRRGAIDTARLMLADMMRLNGHSIFCYVMLNLWLEQVNHGNHR